MSIGRRMRIERSLAPLALAAAALLALGCGDDDPAPQGSGAEDVAAPTDTSGSDDAPTTDVTSPDAATSDVAAPDEGPAPTDSGPCSGPECTEGQCAELTQVAQAALTAAAQGCTEPLGCTMFEYPICGSAGCFMGPIASGADLEGLQAAATAAGEAGCGGFSCGCDPKFVPPVCLGGQCRTCPGDCGESCDDLEDVIEAAAEQIATGCSTDTDCAVTTTPNCFLGERIQCHALAHRASASPADVMALLGVYTSPEMACQWAACDCQYTAAVCKDGACTPAEDAPAPCVGLDQAACNAEDVCSAFSGLPAPGGCSGDGAAVYAGCEYTANAGACGEAETCAQHLSTGERLIFPSTCHPSTYESMPWEACCAPPGGCTEGSATDVGKLCVRGEMGADGESLVAGKPAGIQIYPKGCYSSSCTVVHTASCTVATDGLVLGVAGTFCLEDTSGEGEACTPDCSGGGFGNCASATLTEGSYTVVLGDLSLSFEVPSELPFGGVCNGSPF